MVSALSENDNKIRSFAVTKILEVKELGSDPDEVRMFRMPKINFEAKHYMDLINWKSVDIFIPPILQFLTRTEIEDIIQAPYKFPSFPCHSQSVERCVKLVSEASLRVSDYENRHGFILSTQKSRSEMPTFESKQDFR